MTTPPDEAGAKHGDEGEPIGIFPTWRWLYGTVLVWCAIVIILLYTFTVTFDYGAR